MCNNGRKDAIDYATIYKSLWECRNFELRHLWQRSVFLTAFLLACYAGYGSFVSGCATAEKVQFPFVVLNGIALGICLIGLILSFLWIMMAKGSKAWYEHYEGAINEFVERYKDGNVFEGDLAELAGFKIGDIVEVENGKLSSWLWNAKAGSFSVSKINVALGHISTLIWCVLILIHICIAQKKLVSMQEVAGFFEFLVSPNRLIALISSVLLLFWVYSRMVLRSSYFNDK